MVQKEIRKEKRNGEMRSLTVFFLSKFVCVARRSRDTVIISGASRLKTWCEWPVVNEESVRQELSIDRHRSIEVVLWTYVIWIYFSLIFEWEFYLTQTKVDRSSETWTFFSFETWDAVGVFIVLRRNKTL